MVKIKMVKNDTKPDLIFTVLYAEGDNEGTAFNLTNCTVNFYLLKTGDTTLKNTGHTACTVTDAVNGEGKYEWDSGDLDEVGTYRGEIEVTYPDATKQTVYDEINIHVRADYDNA
jgi:Rib/alpha/Esp surface antigen-like repeat protein